MRYQKGTFIVVPNRGKLKGIGGNGQALFLWLCSYANTEGNCFPSLNTLADDVGCGRDTIIREMKNLIDLGIVIKNHRKTEDKYLSNEYSILLHEDEGGSSTQLLRSSRERLGVVAEVDSNSIHINSNHISGETIVSQEKPKNDDYQLVTEEDEYGEFYYKNGMKRYTKVKDLKGTPKSTELMKWAKEVKGARFTTPTAQMKSINKMMTSGYSVDEIKAKWAELEQEEFWMDRGIDFNILLSQIGKVKKKPGGALDLTKFRKK